MSEGTRRRMLSGLIVVAALFALIAQSDGQKIFWAALVVIFSVISLARDT